MDSHGLKPEARKCPVSRRHKNELSRTENACVPIFRRLNGGNFLASGLQPVASFLFPVYFPINPQQFVNPMSAGVTA